MDLSLLLENLTNPALLFFFLGLVAVQLKSDLAIPKTSSSFISLYLLLSIGFNGGQELAHSHLGAEIWWSAAFSLGLSALIPVYTFFVLRRKFSAPNSAAVAAAFGSVSAVTFVTAISFLELKQIEFGGHMVAMMALMEAPAIVSGVLLLSFTKVDNCESANIPSLIKHALTNGSVFLILGSLTIGFLANDAQAEGIRPFTTDIFKGFLAVFLLDMGITSGRELQSFLKKSGFALVFSLVVPCLNGILVAMLSGLVTDEIGNRFLFAILAASASYIAVPAAMRIAAPKANPSLYLPMALGIAFPFNITLGMPLYMSVVSSTSDWF